MYRVDNIGEEYEWYYLFTCRDVYNVTITDQWPAEGFDIDVEFPIVIDELAAYWICEIDDVIVVRSMRRTLLLLLVNLVI